jgi:hypothetical protein
MASRETPDVKARLGRPLTREACNGRTSLCLYASGEVA